MAAKLKDALFLGDFEAAQDLEFIVANKITRIINCAGREIANAWERTGIRYLTYYWPETGNCIIFDESNSVLDEIYSFIEEALEAGDSVLVHSTDGVSRACFCAAVYFMLKYRWALPKTLAYLQSKRPDLMPKPGFMRQLQALDASLQRVTKATLKGSSDPAARRYSEWDANLLATNASDIATEDELLLTNTYLNSQPVPEEVIIAAQSSAPMPRAPAAPPSHMVGSVHFASQISTIAGAGPHRPGSAPAVGGRKPGSSGISWIDDPRRSGTTHSDVPVSPTTRRPTMERPPGSSYSSLAVGAGWSDSSAGTVAVTVASPNGSLSTAKVLPTVNGSISAAAAHVPPQATGSPSKLKSALRGGQRWMQQQGLAPPSAEPAGPGKRPTAADASSTGSARSVRAPMAESKDAGFDSKLDGEDARKLRAEGASNGGAARRTSVGSISARSVSSSSLVDDAAGAGSAGRAAPGAAARPGGDAVYGRPASPSLGTISTATSAPASSTLTGPQVMSSALAALTTNYPPSAAGRPPSPGPAGRGTMDFGATPGGGPTARAATSGVAASSVAATAAQLQRSAIMLSGSSAVSTSMTSSLSATSTSMGGSMAKTIGPVRAGVGFAGGGPVKATAAVLPAASGAARAGTAMPGMMGGSVPPGGTPTSALASLSSGNLSRTLGTGAASTGSLSSTELDNGFAGASSMARVGGAAAGPIPSRTASSRVRGYSPGPGKARERAAATAATKPVAGGLATGPGSGAPTPVSATAAALSSSAYGGGGSYAATGGGYGISQGRGPVVPGSFTASSGGTSASVPGGGYAPGTIGSAVASSRGRTASPSSRPLSASLAPLASSSSSSFHGDVGGSNAGVPSGFVRSGGLTGSMKTAAQGPTSTATSGGARSASVGGGLRAATPTRPASAQPTRGLSPGPEPTSFGGTMRAPSPSPASGLASSAFLSASYLGGGQGFGSSYGGGGYPGAVSSGSKGGFMQYSSLGSSGASAGTAGARPASGTQQPAAARGSSPMGRPLSATRRA